MYASADIKANVLSFPDVEVTYNVTYKKGKSFTVQLPDRNHVYLTKI